MHDKPLVFDPTLSTRNRPRTIEPNNNRDDKTT